MPLMLDEEQVRSLLDMPGAIDAVEDAFRAMADGSATNRPRQRVRTKTGVLHVMPAGWEARGYVGFKAYTSFADTRFWFWLFDAADGRPLAVISADTLGRIRTGAATGVATRHMARADASVVGIIGTGSQAAAQIEAVCNVRPITHVKCYSRDEASRRAFAAEMSGKLGLSVEPAASARDAVEGADVVITITSARTPVCFGEWLSPGTHINAAGANWAKKREIDDEAVRRSAVIAVDSLEQGRAESGDLIAPIAAGVCSWERVRELAEVVAGRQPGRTTAEEITLFKSNGLAIEDVAVAALVYERATAGRIGHDAEMPDGRWKSGESHE